MRRLFVSNALLIVSLNVLIKFFWVFGIDRTVQNTVGALEYGRYFVAFNFCFLFTILLDFGFQNYNNRLISQQNNLLSRYLPHGLFLKFILGWCYLFVVFISAWALHYDAAYFRMIGLLAVLHILVSVLNYLRSNISALLMFKTDSFLSVLDRSLGIIFCSILLWGGLFNGKFQIEWFVYMQLISYLIAVIVAYTILKKKTQKLFFIPNKAQLFLFIKKGLPYALLSFLMTLYARLDSIFLERILGGDYGSSQAGIYASAFRILDSINMIPALFAGLLLPLFAKMIKDQMDVVPVLKSAFTLLFIASSVFSICTFFYSEELMKLLYTAHVTESTSIYRILTFSFVPYCLIWIFGTLLTAGGFLKQLNIVSGIAVGLNVLCNFVLIPHFEAEGAAFSNLTTNLFCAIAQVLIAVHIFKIQQNYLFLLKIFVFIAGIISFCYLAKYFIPVWYWGAFAAGMASLLWIFVIRLINIKQIFALIKKEK